MSPPRSRSPRRYSRGVLTGGPALARWLSSTSRGKARYQLNDAVSALSLA